MRKIYIMKYYLYTLALILVISTSYSNAQTDIAVRKKEFKKERQGFREAWKHVNTGDGFYTAEGVWYGSAYDEYLKAIAYNGSNAELNYKTGVSALFSDNKEEAAEFFLKAIELDMDVTDDIHLLTGRALQYTGQYEKAIENYNLYLDSGIKKPKEGIAAAKKYIEECTSALDIIEDTLRLDIVNIGSEINSYADDYAALFSADGETIYFASRREMPGANSKYDDSKFDENIFFSVKNNDSWTSPITPGKKVTTDFCESPLYLTPAGDELYIYVGYEGGGDIKVSKRKRGKWRSPSSVPFKINTRGAETSITFSPSGDEVWYVTDKGKRGYGGKDIYMVKRIKERKWSKPVNAGPMINTVYDEESLRFSESGDTLWFASRGHTSMGGYDIFFSVRNEAGVWEKAVNYGFPLNTPWDELFYQPVSGDDSTFYFVSNKSGGMGGLDIYKGRLLPPEPVVIPVAPPEPDTVVVRDTVVVVKEVVPEPEPVVEPEPPEEVLYLIGRVSDSETDEPILAKIDVIDLSTDLVVATTASSDMDGTYRMKMPEKKSYMVDFRASGFLSEMKRVNIPETYSGESYNLDVTLIKVKVGKKVVLNNILFETGKSVLTTSSYEELDRLVGILEDNPLMRIEISGHTDNTGSLALNMRLSETRAQAVVEYLVQKGVDRSRLEYKGYGPDQPIADNATAEGRKMNRRVEFKILEF
jgi:outer membrane protein OmpA-like peptidoglycan-associated protein/tetratricopeptide (TPR) repeat protein